MLKNAPDNDRKTTSDAPSANYLAEQIADARLALESTLDDLTLDLGKAADLRRWVRRYPWPALGAAVVAGFTVAHVVKSKRGNTVATAESDGDVPAATSEQKIVRGEAAAGGWRSTMISALFDILRLAVTQFINASVRQAGTSANAAPAPRADRDPSHVGDQQGAEFGAEQGTHPTGSDSKLAG